MRDGRTSRCTSWRRLGSTNSGVPAPGEHHHVGGSIGGQGGLARVPLEQPRHSEDVTGTEVSDGTPSDGDRGGTPFDDVERRRCGPFVLAVVLVGPRRDLTPTIEAGFRQG